MHGKGVFAWPSGQVYEGEYYEDQKHGFGKFKEEDGSYYEGNWLFGQRHGRGALI